MKVEKNPNPSYILGYLLELIMKVWRLENKNSSKSANFSHFFPEKSFA
jgi:hypothetical protein